MHQNPKPCVAVGHKGKACPWYQPCPKHTRKGQPRRASLPAGTVTRKQRKEKDHVDNVTSLFTDDTKARPSTVQYAGGASRHNGDRRPRDKRINMGKRWTEIYTDIQTGQLTWEDFVETLDAEELASGRLKDKHGGFTGRPPSFIPRQFLMACQRELYTRFSTRVQANLEKATDELIRLAFSTEMEAKDRVKALQYLIERVVGKVPDKLEISAADPWEQIVSDIVSEVDADKAPKEPRYLQRRSSGPEEEGSTT